MKSNILILLLVGSFFVTSCDIFSNKSPVIQIKDDEPVIVQGAGNESSLVFVSPENDSKEVWGKTPITFLWDKPIFSLQDPAKTQAFLRKHISIDPEIQGSWSVIGTTGIVFEPKKAWKDSSRYTVTLDTTLFPDAQIVTFSTRKLEMNAPDSWNLVHLEPLTVSFNQNVDPSLWNHITFSPDISGTWTSGSKEVWKDGAFSEEKDPTALEFIPESSWSEDTNYTIILEPGASGSDGSLPLTESQSVEFKTDGPFTLNQGCDQIVPQDIYRNISLSFSAKVPVKNLIDSITIYEIRGDNYIPINKDILQKHIKDNLYGLGETDDVYYISIPSLDSTWNATKKYRIALGAGLKDVFGRTLSSKVDRIASDEVRLSKTPAKEHYCDFEPKFPTQIRPIFFPQTVNTYAYGVVPEFSVGASGDISGLGITLTKSLPNQYEYTSKISFEKSFEKQSIQKIRLSEHFPEMFIDGKIPTGWYELELDWRSNGYQQTRSTEFVVMDFPVMLKGNANDSFDVYPRSFDSSPEPTQYRTTWYHYQYNQNKRKDEYVRCASLDSCKENYWLIALLESGERIGIGSTFFENGISPYEANLDFSPYAYKQHYIWAPFTDRPLYRPGDTIHLASIFRERDAFARSFPLKNASSRPTPYTLNIRQPNGEVAYTATWTAINGDLEETWQLPDDTPFGQYGISLQMGNESSSTQYIPFYVTEFRKPTFLIHGSFDSELAIQWDKLKANINATYAHGWVLADAPIDYTVTLFGYEKSNGWFWFPREKHDKVLIQASAQLDKDGTFQIPIDFSIDEDDEIDWDTLTVETTVEASEAQISSYSMSLPYASSAYRLQLNPSKWFYDSEETIRISGHVSDQEDADIQTDIDVVTYLQKWVRTDKKNHLGNYEREWEMLEEEISRTSVQSDTKGDFSYESWAPTKKGEYVIRFSAQDKKWRFTSDEQNFWIWSHASNEHQIRTNVDNKILWLYPDVSGYETSNTATILFPHNEWEITKAYATIERGSVLQSVPVDTDNQTISFVVEPWMAPNVFLTLVIEWIDTDGNPHMKYWSVNIPVSDPDRDLSIKVTPKHVFYQPWETATIEIKTTAQWKPKSAHITVAIVDKTLLALKERTPLNLWQTFLSELPLWVETYHALANYMSPTDLQEIYEDVAQMEAKLAWGMGDGKDGDELKPRGDFRDTAFFTTQITTSTDGLATIEVPLPDNLTSWHVWTLGHTNDNAFGEAEATFSTSLPLRIIPELPNILRSGDNTSISAHIFREPSDNKSQLQARIMLPEKYADWIDPSDKEISFEMSDTQEYISFPITVPWDSGIDEGEKITFQIHVQDQHGNEDMIKIDRDILPPVMTTTVSEMIEVQESTDIALIPSDASLDSTAHVSISGELYTTLDWIPEITHYRNYGDVSSDFTNATAQLLYSKIDASHILPSGEDLREIQQKIQSHQKRDGGFGYWAASRYAHIWLTARVLSYADVWERAGYWFPVDVLTRAEKWLYSEMFRACDLSVSWRCPTDTERNQAAYILAKQGMVSMGNLSKLHTYTSSLTSKVWWMLTASYIGNFESLLPEISTKLDSIQEELERKLIVRDRYAFWEWGKANEYIQNEFLTALIYRHMRQEEILPTHHHKALAYLTKWTHPHLSSVTALQILDTLVAQKDSDPKAAYPIPYHVTANQKDFLSGSVVNANETKQKEMVIESDTILTFSPEDASPYYADISLQEIFPAQSRPAISKGFWIEKEIFHIGDTDRKNPVDTLKAWDTYTVRLRVATSSSHRDILIRDPLISWVEALNTDLDNVSSAYDEASDICAGWCSPLVNHKEFDLHEARFFIERLDPGIHEILYTISARIPGSYEQLPSEIFEIDYPEVFATTVGSRWKVIGSDQK